MPFLGLLRCLPATLDALTPRTLGQVWVRGFIPGNRHTAPHAAHPALIPRRDRHLHTADRDTPNARAISASDIPARANAATRDGSVGSARTADSAPRAHPGAGHPAGSSRASSSHANGGGQPCRAA